MTTATARLNTALITMAQRGERPRCADPITHVMWTSEDQHDRDIAAQWCSGCDVLQLCGAAAEERGGSGPSTAAGTLASGRGGRSHD
jgi:hypothetical protein